MIKVFDSDEVKELCVHVYKDCIESNDFKIWGREYKNKYLVIDDFSTWSNIDRLIRRKSRVHVYPNSKLFFSSSCKMSRDLFRNSGYSIVRDPDKSDCVVIPNPSYNYPTMSTMAIVNDKEGGIYLLTIRKNSYDDADNNFIKENRQRIEDYLDMHGYTISACNDFGVFNVAFVNKIQEYKDILLKTFPNRNYCIDIYVPITIPTTISPETLLVWKNSSFDLFQNAVCASDWQDYPFTLNYFINSFVNFSCENVSEKFRYVLRQIRYTDNGAHNYVHDNDIIQPKDWNMLQDFLLLVLGLGEQGGYIKERQSRDIDYEGLLASRIAIKPRRISEPMTQSTLLDCVRN